MHLDLMSSPSILRPEEDLVDGASWPVSTFAARPATDARLALHCLGLGLNSGATAALLKKVSQPNTDRSVRKRRHTPKMSCLPQQSSRVRHPSPPMLRQPGLSGGRPGTLGSTRGGSSGSVQKPCGDGLPMTADMMKVMVARAMSCMAPMMFSLRLDAVKMKSWMILIF